MARCEWIARSNLNGTGHVYGAELWISTSEQDVRRCLSVYYGQQAVDAWIEGMEQHRMSVSTPWAEFAFVDMDELEATLELKEEVRYKWSRTT